MIGSIKNIWEVKVYVSTFPLRQRMVVHLSTTVSRLVIQECFLLKPYWWDGNKCIGNNYLCRPSLLDSSRPINYWVYNWRSTKLVCRYSEADWTVSSNSFWCLVLASCSLSECMYILVSNLRLLTENALRMATAIRKGGSSNPVDRGSVAYGDFGDRGCT